MDAEEQEFFKRQIEEWKQEHYGAVYVTEIGDTNYIWRGLSRAEFKNANSWYDDDFDRAEYVCRQCVLHPQIDDYSLDMFAGVPETLTEEILRASGFTLTMKEFDQKIFEYDQEMQTFDNQISCIIKEAFPDIQLEAIEHWQLDKVLWYYSRAKWTLEAIRGIKMEREEAAPGIPGMPPL